MKKCRKIPVYLLLLVALLSLTACGDKRPEATTVCVVKGGKLKQILVDQAPDYSVAELQEYTEDRIAAYLKTEKKGDVKLDSCEEKDGVICMELLFNTAADYTAMTGMTCFYGTLEEAVEAGMAPQDTLVAPDGTTADFSALAAEKPEYHMLVLAENVLVQTQENILYATAPAVITGEKTATIGDGDADTSGFIPRKTDTPAFLIFK